MGMQILLVDDHLLLMHPQNPMNRIWFKTLQNSPERGGTNATLVTLRQRAPRVSETRNALR